MKPPLGLLPGCSFWGSLEGSSTSILNVGGPQHTAFCPCSIPGWLIHFHDFMDFIEANGEISIPFFPWNPNFSLIIHLITTWMANGHWKFNLSKPEEGTCHNASQSCHPLHQPSLASHLMQSLVCPHLDLSLCCFSDLMSCYSPPYPLRLSKKSTLLVLEYTRHNPASGPLPLLFLTWMISFPKYLYDWSSDFLQVSF